MIRRRAAFEDLDAAITWLREAWSARDIPSRLHERASEGEGLFYTQAFSRYLEATPDDKAVISTQRQCNHLRLTTTSIFECPDCQGAGTFTTSREAWVYPTWRAMERLRSENRRAHDRVLTLVINNFDVPDTTQVLGCREGHILDGIRALYARYERAPSGGRRVAWVDRSESQRRAEGEMSMMGAVA